MKRSLFCLMLLSWQIVSSFGQHVSFNAIPETDVSVINSRQIPELFIERANDTQVRLSWNPVPGALKYKVYQSDTPLIAGEPGWAFLEELFGLSLLVDAAVNKEFFYVTAEMLNDGLVAYYPFNSNTNDESGNALNGVNHGATYCPDRFLNPNSAAHFNGSSYVFIPPSGLLDINASISVSCWINMPILSDGWFVWRGSTLSARDPYCFGISSQNLHYRRDVYNNSEVGQTISYLLPTDFINNWHHVVCTYDHDYGIYLLIIDGQQQASASYTPVNVDYNTTGHWNCLGAVDNGDQYYIGLLDDVRIYDRVLTPAEIDLLFHEGGF